MNAWVVLGIPPTSDEATIKRAYAAQLKLHKPQVDPEGFQRLREAYTWALRWGDRFEQEDWALDGQVDQDEPEEHDEHHEQDPHDQQQTPTHALAVPPDERPMAQPGATANEQAAPAHTSADRPAGAAIQPPPPAPPAYAPSHPMEQVHDASADAESVSEASTRLLAAFDALTHLGARKDVRQALYRWANDPALDHFDVRRGLSLPVFERTIAWLLENAKRRRALLAAPEFVQPLERLFDWRNDELELTREFGDDVETVFVALDPTRALAVRAQPPKGSFWASLKRIAALIGLVVGLLIGIVQCMRSGGEAEPLYAAERAYDRGDYERAITLAEQASRADDFERGQLVVRALLALGRAEPARVRAEALVADSPGLPDAQMLVADVYVQLDRCADATRHYDRAQAIEWSVDAGNNLAWGLATCPGADARDGARAVTLAERVVREKPIAIYIDTLAAALAETGDFAGAVREQQRAIRAAGTEGLAEDVVRGMRARLLGYQQRRAYHRSAPTTAPAPHQSRQG